MFEILAWYTLKLFGFTRLWGRRYALTDVDNEVYGIGSFLMAFGFFICVPFWAVVLVVGLDFVLRRLGWL
jgi:hypothetical protein